MQENEFGGLPHSARRQLRDPSNEQIVLDQIKIPTEEKKPSRNERGTSESNSEK